MKTSFAVRLLIIRPVLMAPALLFSSLLPMQAVAESVGEAVRVREVKPDPVVIQTRPVVVEESAQVPGNARRNITYSTTHSDESCFYHEEHGHIHCEESGSEVSADAPDETTYQSQYEPERIIFIEEREQYPTRYYTRYQTRYESRRYYDPGFDQGIGIGLAIGLPILLHHSYHNRHYSGHGHRFGYRNNKGHKGGHKKRSGHRKGRW